MSSPDPSAGAQAPAERKGANASGDDTTPNIPQTRGQNPDNSHRGAQQGEAITSAPNDPSKRSEATTDRRPEGGGQSQPAATNASSEPGGTDGYANPAARSGSVEQGIGSRGGSYNDEYDNSPKAGKKGNAPTRPAEGPDSGGASTGRAPSDTSERV